MRTIRNITKHEFVGTKVELVSSPNTSLNGMKGVIVDESRNMFTISTKNGEKKVLKGAAKFKTNVQNVNVLIDGNVLVGRAEDRIKK